MYGIVCTSTGVAEISDWFPPEIPPHMIDYFIKLLEKFEVALRINQHQILIPSLMSKQMSYPKSTDELDEVQCLFQPPLRRFWVADFVPAGFWPRLICRVATDQQIGRVSAVNEGVRVKSSKEQIL